MDSLTAARTLIGHSLAFHVIIVAISIGLPFLLSIFEWYAWRKNSDRTRAFVRLLANWTAVFVIGGVMSGTTIALQFSTLWAPFVDASRPYVGKFFQLESYMFLIEAVFLTWYLSSMKLAGTKRHFLISLPINIGAIGSAFFITVVNAWMNNPSAIFTTTTANEISHSVVSYLFSTALLVLAFVASRSLRRHGEATNAFIQWLMGRLVLVTAVLLIILALLGHQSAVNIAQTQPTKLAAIEILDKTEAHAPLRIGGHINADGVAEGGIVLPEMLSILAGYSPSTVVAGLNATPKSQWPPLLVHTLFDIKMGLVGVSCAVVLVAAFFYLRRRSLPKWVAIVLIPSGILGLVMVELGWLLTEFGRQSWTIAGKQTTANALTHGANIQQSGLVFISLFAVLGVATVAALIYTTRLWRDKEKLSW